MPIYEIDGPDGKTYEIEGPEGATRDQVRAAVLKRNPSLSAQMPTAAAPAEKPWDPTEDMSTFDKMAAGAGGRAMELYRGGKQLLGIDPAETQRQIDEQKKTDAPLKNTGAGLAGGVLTDIATLAVPGGMVARGAGKLLPAAAEFARSIGPVKAGIALSTGGGAAQSAIEPVASDESQANKTILGTAGGLVGGGIGSAIGRAINPVRGEVSPLVDALLKHDVPLSAGQRSGHPILEGIDRALESIPGGSVFTAAGSAAQQKGYTRAVAKYLGEDTDKLTTEALAKAEKRITDVFEQVGNAAPRPFTPQLSTEVATIVADARRAGKDAGRKSLPAAEQVDAVERRLKDPMLFSGTGYNTLRSDLTSAAFEYGKSGNHLAAETAGKLRDAVDAEARRLWGGPVGVPQQSVGAGQAALTTPLNPTAAGPTAALPDAWEQYAVLKDLLRPGVVSAEGTVNPKALQATLSSKERLADTGYDQLRNAGEKIATEQPSGYQMARALTALGAGAGGATLIGGLPLVSGGAGALAAVLGAIKTLGTHKNLVDNPRLQELVKALRSMGQTAGTDLTTQ